jgi:thiol:disulfide interchange protein DsbG
MRQVELRMRYLIFGSALLLAPASAVAQTCAVPPDQRPAAVQPSAFPQVSSPEGERTTAAAGVMTVHALTSSEIAAVPALKRIASNGAELSDLGTKHGLRTIFARNGDTFQVFYLAPDGQAVVGGVMWDESGHNITRDQVAPIPGTIPTVRIGTTAAPSQTIAVTSNLDASLLKVVAGLTYGTIGPAAAPHLWMFVDPMCAFSIRAMQSLRPYVEAGRIQLAVIPLSVLDYEDQGRSTPAAEVMVSFPADQMVAAWTGQQLTGTPPTAAANALQANMAGAAAIHLRGTPTFVWRKSDGSVGRADGLPEDIGTMISAIAH